MLDSWTEAVPCPSLVQSDCFQRIPFLRQPRSIIKLSRIIELIAPCRNELNERGEMPRKRTQMAMPATDRGSQDSAGELEVKYEPTNNMDQNSPTHVPQNIQQENERLRTTLRMLQEEMQKSKEREKAVLNDLRKEIQQAQAKLMSEQQQQNESNI